MDPRKNYRPEHLAHMEQRGVMPLDLLPPAAQDAALKNIVATEEFHFRGAIRAARARFSANVHAEINNPHAIPSLVRQLRNLRRIERDPEHCRRYVLGNLCEFDAAGRYRPYRIEAVNPFAAVEPAATSDPEESSEEMSC